MGQNTGQNTGKNTGQKSEQPAIFRLDLPASLRYLNVIGACVGAILERTEGVDEPESLRYAIELAVQETCTNVVEHAYAGQDGRIDVQFTLHQDPRRLTVDVRDTGKPFNPDAVPEPTLEDVQVRGYGLFLMRELMDEIDYHTGPGGNHWRMVKAL